MLRQLTGTVRHINNEVVRHKEDHLLDKHIALTPAFSASEESDTFGSMVFRSWRILELSFYAINATKINTPLLK